MLLCSALLHAAYHFSVIDSSASCCRPTCALHACVACHTARSSLLRRQQRWDGAGRARPRRAGSAAGRPPRRGRTRPPHAARCSRRRRTRPGPPRSPPAPAPAAHVARASPSAGVPGALCPAIVPPRSVAPFVNGGAIAGACERIQIRAKAAVCKTVYSPLRWLPDTRFRRAPSVSRWLAAAAASPSALTDRPSGRLMSGRGTGVQRRNQVAGGCGSVLSSLSGRLCLLKCSTGAGAR